MNIDESLYSRQLYAIGKDAMKSIIDSKILIINLDPLAVEICKNIVLSGIGNITIADNKNLSDADFGNYYFNSTDIGKNRADVIGCKLKQLNPNVSITKYSKDVSYKLLKKFDLVVFVDCKYDFLKEMNNFCHINNIKTIACSSKGFMGYVFCDFVNFICNDMNGEKLHNGFIMSNNGLECTTAKQHDFEIGTKFKINNNVYSVTSITNKNTFMTDVAVSFVGEYTEVKQTVEIKFSSFKDSVDNPEFVYIDYKNLDMPIKLHKINIKVIKDDFSFNDEFEEKIINSLDGQLVPVNSIIGGIVANQIISGVSNKYTPIKQWLYYECSDICNPTFDMNYDYNKIYQNQIKVIGTELQKKLNEYSVFIVGAGAIGCEHLKNFSMMGVGNINITDMDIIEKSNLSRQFLFNNSDVGKFKAETAVKKTKTMNPYININYKLNKVGVDTENIFNHNFYNSINCIVNALDNVDARIYMDNKALIYGKPLLESGTLGLKGNTQVIIPNITESYQSSHDKVDDMIPVCTLKNFPYEISHCIQWAREQFENLFVIPFKTYMDLKKLNSVELQEKLNKTSVIELIEMKTNIEYINNSTFEKYNDFYNKNYRQNISNIITKYPFDHVTDNGEKFWSGTKRFPHIIDFDKSDQYCNENYQSFLQIIHDIYDCQKDDITFVPINKKLENETTDIALTEEDDKKNKEKLVNDISSVTLIDNITTLLSKTNFNFKLIEFEKDDDTNRHIDFITSASNLRALNYSIKPVDKFETKGIAGKIIPALATTTSIVSGFIAIELYKLLTFTNIDKFKNTFISLGISYFGSSEPIACQIKKFGNLEMSIWTQIKIKDMTFIKLFELIKTKYDLHIEQIIYNDRNIYSRFMNNIKKNNLMDKKLSEITKAINIFLNVTVSKIENDNDENEIISVYLC